MADVPAEDLVFLDETSTQITMTRTCGRAPQGVCLTEAVPRNHGDNLTLLAAIGTDVVKAPLVFPRALNGDIFRQWVPLLWPGQIVVLDNLSVHRSARAEAALRAVGCAVWFLPRYSPDRNPIEQAFSKLKARLRCAGADVPRGGGSGRGRLRRHHGS